MFSSLNLFQLYGEYFAPFLYTQKEAEEKKNQNQFLSMQFIHYDLT